MQQNIIFQLENIWWAWHLRSVSMLKAWEESPVDTICSLYLIAFLKVICYLLTIQEQQTKNTIVDIPNWSLLNLFTFHYLLMIMMVVSISHNKQGYSPWYPTRQPWPTTWRQSQSCSERVQWRTTTVTYDNVNLKLLQGSWQGILYYNNSNTGSG